MNCKSLLLLSLLAALPSRLVGQETDQAPSTKEVKPRPKTTSDPLRVALTVSRYDKDKKVGSLPYTLEVTANDPRGTKLRMGVEVPVAVTTFSAPDGGRATGSPYTSHQYRNVGTNIDCRAEGPEEGRFRLFLTVEQSSLPSTPDSKPAQAGDLPLFRTFNTETSLLLRPGQATQFVAATDPVTGESVRIDVAVEVVK